MQIDCPDPQLPRGTAYSYSQRDCCIIYRPGGGDSDCALTILQVQSGFGEQGVLIPRKVLPGANRQAAVVNFFSGCQENSGQSVEWFALPGVRDSVTDLQSAAGQRRQGEHNPGYCQPYPVEADRKTDPATRYCGSLAPNDHNLWSQCSARTVPPQPSSATPLTFRNPVSKHLTSVVSQAGTFTPEQGNVSRMVPTLEAVYHESEP